MKRKDFLKMCVGAISIPFICGFKSTPAKEKYIPLGNMSCIGKDHKFPAGTSCGDWTIYDSETGERLCLKNDITSADDIKGYYSILATDPNGHRFHHFISNKNIRFTYRPSRSMNSDPRYSAYL